MENSNSETIITDEDFRNLASSPILIFMLVAAADGTVDKKEVATFKRLIGEPKYAMLMAAYNELGVPAGEFMTEVLSSIKNPLEDLAKVGILIDAKIGELATEYKSLLLEFGRDIASASGGFLGIFGNKIGKEEQAMLLMIEAALGKGETATTSNSDKYTAANLFPVLKPASWVKDARGDVAMLGIYQDEEIQDGEPAIAYAIDSAESVQFLNDSPNIRDTHEHALANLEKRLSGLDWEEMSIDLDNSGELQAKGLVFTGDYYCAEGLLSEDIMRRANEKLDSAMIMVIAPARGELFASHLLNPENMEPGILAFASFAIKRYFDSDQAPIAPTCWIVRNGRLAGHVKGLEGLEQQVREATEREAEHEASMLQHDAEMEQDGSQVRLKVICQVLDAEIMFSKLQHVIRGYVQTAIGDHRFNGLVNVSLNINDERLDQGAEEPLRTELDSMFKFLNDQFASMQMKTANGDAIQMQYQLV